MIRHGIKGTVVEHKNMLKSYKDEDALMVTFPLPFDVLCSKNKTTAQHPGNIEYRRLIEEYAFSYATESSKTTKERMTTHIATTLIQRNGRFLKQVSKASSSIAATWQALSVTEARDKISHALRNCAQQHAGVMRIRVTTKSSTPPFRSPSPTFSSMARNPPRDDDSQDIVPRKRQRTVSIEDYTPPIPTCFVLNDAMKTDTDDNNDEESSVFHFFDQFLLLNNNDDDDDSDFDPIPLNLLTLSTVDAKQPLQQLLMLDEDILLNEFYSYDGDNNVPQEQTEEDRIASLIARNNQSLPAKSFLPVDTPSVPGAEQGLPATLSLTSSSTSSSSSSSSSVSSSSMNDFLVYDKASDLEFDDNDWEFLLK